MTTNALQNKLVEALREHSPKWWGRGDLAERVYFNAGVMKGIKVWIQFADAATLAGAEVKARWSDSGLGQAQHPNWIANTEAQWVEKFQPTLESIQTLRDEAGLSEQQNIEAVEAQAEQREAQAQARREAADADRQAVDLHNSMVRAGATELSQLTTAHGNIEIIDGVPANFAHVPFSDAFKFLVSRKTKATENKWLKLAGKAADFRLAVTGFEEKTMGRPGHSRPVTVPVIDGIICKPEHAAAVRAAVAALEAEAETLYQESGEAGRAVAAKLGGVLFKNENPNFKLMTVGQTRTNAKGKTFRCVAAGASWYVAVMEN